MQEDNHEKRMFYKFIFLLMVTILIGIVYLWKGNADDQKKQSPEEVFQKNEQRKGLENSSHELDEDKINKILTDNGDKDTEEEKTEKKGKSKEQMEGSQEEGDLEQKYINQYSKQEVEQAKEQAEKVLALYLLQVTDWDKWNGAVTSSYLEKAKGEMTDFKDKKAKRELDTVELFASQPLKSGKVTYGAFATWHVTVEGKSTSKPMRLYYITLQKDGDKWIVSDMITPDNQNMEGEVKEGK